MELSLDFGGLGFYFVRVDVRSDVPSAPADVDSALPASPAVKSARKKAKEVEVTGDDSPSDEVDTEDSEAGREVEAGGHEMASVDGGRVKETVDGAADGEEHGESA